MSQPVIMLVGSDDELAYLIERYAERGGIDVRVTRALTADQVSEIKPSVVWFTSLETLEAARPRERGVVGPDAPLLVCSSSGDEQRARELGADYCALHPLTYPDFLAALAAVGVGEGTGRPR